MKGKIMKLYKLEYTHTGDKVYEYAYAKDIDTAITLLIDKHNEPIEISKIKLIDYDILIDPSLNS